MRISLRAARPADLELIHAIRRNAILGIDSDSLSPGDRQAWADRRSPEFYARRVAEGGVVIAVSEIGSVAWGSRFDDWITGLYVHSSSRRIGVGRTLMLRLESDIVERGYATAKLESSPNAVAFYANLGYVAVGLSDDAGAIPMEKSLRPTPA